MREKESGILEASDRNACLELFLVHPSEGPTRSPEILGVETMFHFLIGAEISREHFLN